MSCFARVCDGGTAAGFLRFVADAIENPNNLTGIADKQEAESIGPRLLFS